MMRYLAVLAASAVAVLAQVTINTPQGVLACTNTQVTWTGGTPPYILQVQPGGDTSAAALETFTGITGTTFTWHVIEQANTQVFLRLRDSTGVPAESGTFTIQSAGAAVCSGTTGGTSAVAPATDSGAATTPAGTTPAATTPAATTPAATTPAAGGTTTPPASNGSNTSSASHASTTTTHNGASSLQVAGGLVGLVGAVAVALA